MCIFSFVATMYKVALCFGVWLVLCLCGLPSVALCIVWVSVCGFFVSLMMRVEWPFAFLCVTFMSSFALVVLSLFALVWSSVPLHLVYFVFFSYGRRSLSGFYTTYRIHRCDRSPRWSSGYPPTLYTNVGP